MRNKEGIKLLRNIIEYCKTNNISLMSNDVTAAIQYIDVGDIITVKIINGFLTINSHSWIAPTYTLSKEVVGRCISKAEFLLELRDVLSFIAFKDDDILNIFK